MYSTATVCDDIADDNDGDVDVPAVLFTYVGPNSSASPVGKRLRYPRRVSRVRPQIKCDQYWPSRGTETYGMIQVTMLDTVELATYSMRTFALYKVRFPARSTACDQTGSSCAPEPVHLPTDKASSSSLSQVFRTSRNSIAFSNQ